MPAPAGAPLRAACPKEAAALRAARHGGAKTMRCASLCGPSRNGCCATVQCWPRSTRLRRIAVRQPSSMARICAAFPLPCPLCGSNMRPIAFLTKGRRSTRSLDCIAIKATSPRVLGRTETVSGRAPGSIRTGHPGPIPATQNCGDRSRAARNRIGWRLRDGAALRLGYTHGCDQKTSNIALLWGQPSRENATKQL